MNCQSKIELESQGLLRIIFFTDGAICPSQLPKGGKYESVVCAAKYWLIIVVPELFGEKMNL